MLQKHPMYAYIPARDLARARAFYEQKVGLKPKQQIGEGVAYEFASGTACFLYTTPNAGTSRASQAFWQVDDVDREIEELKSRGIVFENYPDMPDRRAARTARHPARHAGHHTLVMPERGIAFTLPGQQLGGKHPLLASAPMKNAGRMEFFRGTGMPCAMSSIRSCRSPAR